MALFGIFGKKKKSKETAEIKKEAALINNTEVKNEAPKATEAKASEVSTVKIEKPEEKKVENKAKETKPAVKAETKKA